ncbi:ubiquitin carboxyl-terminal hydrolase [Besnoitia besnoiti]|uniref:Ubiquitin carboxyl-terminal hydrolase n=1 Tax=Besnoitia besnoiti TaxID=94643 RepID=A0A2A9MDS7_BESBE|nr:ubiquitin carboxyl-terminal hydrolase [Besnoitia besnoiti]PFH34106.1 ubiquitin carboxyl-terminal hydrolase [Besnoitia besnoiti]
MAAPLKLSVKWNKQEFENVEVDVSEPLALLNAQLMTLTGVPADRQKLMANRKLVKSIEDLQAAAKGGKPVKVTMLGTAEGGELKQPQQKTVFLEDLTPAEQAKLLREKNIEPLPPGIANLGNTCYLASVLQMLRTCHELTTAIRSHMRNATGGSAAAYSAASGSAGASHRLALALRDFYSQWEGTTDAAQPLLLVHAIREAFPQFARKAAAGPGGVGGGYMQQDAEECCSCLMSVLSECLPVSQSQKTFEALPARYEKATNFIDALFGFDMRVTTRRERAEASAAGQAEEAKEAQAAAPPETKSEKNTKFTCFLGTMQNPINTLDEGVKFSMAEERIELGGSGGPPTPAAQAGADAGAAASENPLRETLVRSTQFETLPFYFLLQFMRFEWKRAGGQAEKAKICKSVKFAPTLDLYLHCTEELKDSLRIGRAVLALRREREAGGSEENVEKKKGDQNGEYAETPDAPDVAMTDATNGTAAAGAGGAKAYATGFYQLLGIVTHQGRHADSGHYVGWTKKDQREPRRVEEEKRAKEREEALRREEEGAVAKKKKASTVDMWVKFDDDKVTETPWDQIDLAGGRSDYHIAYLLLFREILVDATAEEVETVERRHADQKREAEAVALKKKENGQDEKQAEP